MWQVREVHEVQAELDLRSSGLGRLEVRRLLFDGCEFANAIDLTSWGDERFQVRVCEACADEGCAPGGWLSARQAGEYLLFVPAVAKLAAGDPSWEEWAPPDFVVNQGAPVLDGDARGELARFVPTFAELAALGPLRIDEALKVMQFEAPARVLGNWTEALRLNRDVAVAADWGDVDDHLDAVEALLYESVTDPGQECVLRSMEASDREMVLDLDHATESEWRPILYCEGTPRLRFEPGLVLEPVV